MTLYTGFAGTYTRQTSEGIYQFELDTSEGVLKNKRLAAKVGSPTYLSISENQDFIYSVAQEGEQGGVYAYEIQSRADSVSLKYVSSQLDEGAPPCHLDSTDNMLIAANYHKGSLGMFPTTDEGKVYEGTFVTMDGHGPHARQEKSHVHYAGFSPCKKYVFACDLGGDEVLTYQAENGALKHIATLKVKSGSGPRHLTFHPNGTHAFLISELSSEVAVLQFDDRNGTFMVKQYMSTIPESFTETNDASAIQITEDGSFIYAGNRGHNSIAVFQVNQETMELTFVEHVSSGGEWPRDFTLDPSGSFLVVSNQHSGNVILFKRDTVSGKLTRTTSEIQIPEVVCLKFSTTD
ncbi:MAG TPA: lactonase family protein [Virgibacillus sp.]|nr:lactonase family protein [Virgibacillus sp.]